MVPVEPLDSLPDLSVIIEQENQSQDTIESQLNLKYIQNKYKTPDYYGNKINNY